MSHTTNRILTLAERLRGRTRLSLGEYGALMGWGLDAVQSRADRDQLGVPVRRYGGTGSNRYVLVSDVLFAHRPC